MKHEFKVKQFKDATVYTLESASSGGTSAGAVASISKPMGNVIKRGGLVTQESDSVKVPVKQKPRQGALKTQTGAGAHRDKKKEQKQGKEKHRKPYMEELKDRINALKSKLDENSELAQQMMATARSLGMNPRLRGTPDQERERTQQMLAQRAKDRAEQEKQIAQSDAEKLPELKAEYERMKKEYESLGGSNWQYADREQNLSDRERKARSMEPELRHLAGKIHRAEQAGVEEDAPFLAKAAGGLALGALGAAGAPAIVGLLGPVLGTALAAYGAYNSAKGGMWAVDKLWDLAVKKLGGDDNAEQFAKAHIRAAAKGEDSFNFNGKDFPVKLKPDQVQPAAKAVKQISENRKIANQLVESWTTVKEDIVDPEQSFDIIEEIVESIAQSNNVDFDQVWEDFDSATDEELLDLAEDWQKVNKRDKTDGMSRKAVKAYRRENPGSKLKTAVTTKPSKLKKGGKAAKRRKSFCARMSGMKKAHAGAKTKRDPDSPINKALRRWNCESIDPSQGWGAGAYNTYSGTPHGRGVAEKLNPQAPVDTWVQDFQKADPNKYKQFKNKTPQKKAQMAQAAHYAANEPSKKK